MEFPRRSLAAKNPDFSKRFASVRVLVADRDIRTATLVQRVLMSFGFSHIHIATSGEVALDKLREESYDLILTEWEMKPMTGIDLTRAIRQAKDDERLRRDIPIIMLTARGEKEAVEAARDAGITEFLVKPFSASTISHRLVQVIDKPRVFVEAGNYVGPCRRRRDKPPEGVEERRGARKQAQATITPPNEAIREQLRVSAAELLGPVAVERAQEVLLAAESDFLDWAKDDIASLEVAYGQLALKPGDRVAHDALLDIAYAIKSQAGIFGYALGTEVGGMLVEYLGAHRALDAQKLTVVRKHIDTISVIFREKIKESGQELGRELVRALHQLIEKVGD